MTEQTRHRLTVACMPLGAVAMTVLLHGRAAAMAAVAMGSVLLIVSGVLLIGMHRDRRD